MKLYLVRHAIAKEGTDDAKRPLTKKGEKEMRRVAEWLAECKYKGLELWHSGLVRAEQSAKILAKELGLKKKKLSVHEGLKPEDDPTGFAATAMGRNKDLMVVGHLPHLGRLASLLLAGQPELEVLDFPKSGVACLRKNGDKDQVWVLEWLVGPELI